MVRPSLAPGKKKNRPISVYLDESTSSLLAERAEESEHAPGKCARLIIENEMTEWARRRKRRRGRKSALKR